MESVEDSLSIGRVHTYESIGRALVERCLRRAIEKAEANEFSGDNVELDLKANVRFKAPVGEKQKDGPHPCCLCLWCDFYEVELCLGTCCGPK